MNLFKANKYTFDLNKKTLVMGILNVTPDSFSDGGKYRTAESALKRAEQIENEGADIIDIGAQSTRPGFTEISPQEEWNRLEPILKNLKTNIPVSIDTFYPEVAKKCLDINADIINDVTGLENPEMLKTLAGYNCGIIINHNRYNLDINSFFKEKLEAAKKAGINSERLCFDPGIGFSKNQIQDAYIIKNLKSIKLDGFACLVGISRKRVIGVNCGNPPPQKRLYGTIAANTICVQNGANIIRVHDVAEAVQATKITDAILKNNYKEE